MRMVEPSWLSDIRGARRHPDEAMGRRIVTMLRWLSVIAAVGMCFVLQQGTLVTNSGSAAGCGNTWPLCHGEVLPEFSGVGGAATLIEFTHRIAVPIESTLIIALAAGMLWIWWGRWEAYLLAPAMVFFLFLQAILGALAVAYPTTAEILAAHFGISLMAFASIVLAAAFVLEKDGGEAVRDVPIDPGLKWAIRGSLVYTYIVVYLGAYVRHVGASLACLDWPLCNGRVIPRFAGGVATQFMHRVGAAVLVLVIAGIFLAVRRIRRQRPDLYRSSLACLVLVALQALSGALVVETRIAILSTLVHAFFISLLFGVQAYMCLHTVKLPVAAHGATQQRPRAATPRISSTA